MSDEIQSRLRETDAQQKTKIQMLTERVAQLEKESTDARKKVSPEYPCKYPECPEDFAVFCASVRSCVRCARTLLRAERLQPLYVVRLHR
jgi:hypothetical protein